MATFSPCLHTTLLYTGAEREFLVSLLLLVRTPVPLDRAPNFLPSFTLVHMDQVTQSCLTLWEPMDWNLGSSVHGILQTRTLEWAAMPSSRESSWLRDRTHVSCGSCIAGRFFTAEPLGKAHLTLIIYLKACSWYTVTLEVRTSTREFGGEHNNSEWFLNFSNNYS